MWIFIFLELFSSISSFSICVYANDSLLMSYLWTNLTEWNIFPPITFGSFVTLLHPISPGSRCFDKWEQFHRICPCPLWYWIITIFCCMEKIPIFSSLFTSPMAGIVSLNCLFVQCKAFTSFLKGAAQKWIQCFWCELDNCLIKFQRVSFPHNPCSYSYLSDPECYLNHFLNLSFHIRNSYPQIFWYRSKNDALWFILSLLILPIKM